jgi:hypothetical protein
MRTTIEINYRIRLKGESELFTCYPEAVLAIRLIQERLNLFEQCRLVIGIFAFLVIRLE